MEIEKPQLQPVETLAVLYLVLPLFLFFATFIRFEIAIPACVLILHQLYEILHRTSWRRTRELLSWETLFILGLSTILLVWLYGAGSLSANYDWYKHYSVVNFLAQHPWPPAGYVDGVGNATLRYYAGWYLVPAAVVKLAGAHFLHVAVLTWSTLGLTVFLEIVRTLVGKHRSAIVASLAFIAFGGANIVGKLIADGRIAFPGELQWWAGWIEYNSPIIALAFAPQHTLSAWLAVALFMRYRTCTASLPFCALVSVAVAYWSPFSAIGLIPFLCALAATHGLRPLVLGWRSLLSVLILAIPIGTYLTSHPEQVPHGFIGSLPCVLQGLSCFSIKNYILFIVIEVGAPLAILFWRRENEQGFLASAAITLCLIPFYKVGENNDFAMRVSGPALAVLAILCAKLLLRGTRVQSLAIVAVLLLALPEVVVELARPLTSSEHVTPDVTFPTSVPPEMLPQYLVPSPLWILRT